VKRPEMQSGAVAILESVSRYVYGEAQRAHDREEHEDFSITLKLLQLLREGWKSGPDIFSLACSYAVGLCHARYLYKRAERAAFERRELLSITPDYDYSKEPLPDRDPSDGRRRYYGKSGGIENARAIKEAAARLGITRNAIYYRLRRGWTWERATSKTAHQFRSVAAQRSSRHDAGSTSSTHEDYTPADFGLGDFPKSDGRHPVPNRARTASHAALPVADRRGTAKKRMDSPAQAQRNERSRVLNRTARERAAYFGA